MNKNQIIGLLALTIVLSGCSKGRSYDNGTNMPEYNVSTNYQPNGGYQEHDYQEYDYQEYDYQEYDNWEDTNNNQITENTDYNRICKILESYGYILDGNFSSTLSCSDDEMDMFAKNVLVDLENLKLAYDNDDFESINTFESNLVDNTKQLQKLARDYIIRDIFIEGTVDEKNQEFLGGKKHDPFFRDISTVNDVLTCFEQLSLRAENGEVHYYVCAYKDALLNDGSDNVIFCDWYMVEMGANFSESISSLYKNNFDETLKYWSYDTIDSDMDSLYDQYYQDNNLLSSLNSNSKTFTRKM